MTVQYGQSEHINECPRVGIVEKIENNIVYAVEGNSSNVVKQKEYQVNSNVIFGYGIPNY